MKPTGIFSKKPITEDCSHKSPGIVVTVVVVIVGDEIVSTVVDTDINKLDSLSTKIGSAISSGIQKSKR